MSAPGGCQICGRPVPFVEGWAGSIAGYRRVLATWQDRDDVGVDGELHFACMRELEPVSAFTDECLRMATAGYEVLEFDKDGEPFTVERTGLQFGEEVFRGTTCRVLRNAAVDLWMVVEESGPWYRFKPAQLKAVAAGEPVVPTAGVVPFRLPEDLPAQVAAGAGDWDLRALLDHLGVTDRYPDLLDAAGLDYEAMEYEAAERVLTFSATAPLPLPQEAVAFRSGYATRYEPKRFDDE